MSYLKLNKTMSDPFLNPGWVEDAEDATSFNTREQAEVASVRVLSGKNVVYDEEQESWYVENP